MVLPKDWIIEQGLAARDLVEVVKSGSAVIVRARPPKRKAQ